MYNTKNKCYHLTLSTRLDSILANGLLPNAQKLFGERHSTPSLGGVYYTKKQTDILHIVNNLAKQGWLAKSDLVILSFKDKPEYIARIDEDDFFRVESDGKGGRGKSVRYIGPDFASDLVQKIIGKYNQFHTHMSKENFQALQKMMTEFFELADKQLPRPQRGNFLNSIPVNEIQVEAVLKPYLGKNKENGRECVIWKLLEKGEDGLLFRNFLNLCHIEPDVIDHYYPWDCILEYANKYNLEKHGNYIKKMELESKTEEICYPCL